MESKNGNNIEMREEKKRKEIGKFIADLRKDKEGRELVSKVIEEANSEAPTGQGPGPLGTQLNFSLWEKV